MLKEYLNEIVVVDTSASIAYIGYLVKVEESSLYLDEVTIFDDSVNKIPLEQFLVECASYGTSPSRKSIWINRDKIISVSLFRDIIVPGPPTNPG